MSFQTHKASFIFGTQFKIFWMKTGRLVPLTAKYLTLSRPSKVWQTSSEYSICHQWFNRNVMKLREYFLYAKKTKMTTLFNNSTLTPFWRVTTGRKLRMLFCVSHATRIRCFHSNQSINKRRSRIRVERLTQNSILSLRPVDIIQNSTTLMQRRLIFEKKSNKNKILCIEKVFS